MRERGTKPMTIDGIDDERFGDTNRDEALAVESKVARCDRRTCDR